MLATLIIVFREVLEAGLVIGIVLAATEGVARRGRWIAGGIAAGVSGAALLAAFAGVLSNAFSGSGQELFNAAILLIAVVMLGVHITWMASHGRQMAQEMKAMGRAVVAGDRSLTAMALVVTMAVLREGSEVVLFLFGIATSTHEGAAAMLTGGALGVLAGAGVSWLLYRGLVAIPMKHLFKITNAMIALLAAGMAGQAAAILSGVGVLPTLGDELWDTSGILRDDGIAGRALHALVGYSDRPPGIQVLAFLVTLAALALLSRLAGQAPRVSHRQPTTPATHAR
ncbi:MAG TPA: FTR1 family protein [Alphaproteobacteria bacterium]|jgi:high-affinity iron transporter|nr:FTR1 family protein [Alphaproteobacteria bacterium]